MAADRVDSRVGRSGPASVPARTCIGCRVAAAKSDLLRVVAVQTPAGTFAEIDHPARRPGRGAYLHPDRACLDLAVRRRAFPRALRVPGPIHLDGLVGDFEASTAPEEPRRSAGNRRRPTQGG
ncbi:MAG: YlxR family protein [Actinomycetota bacterium]|nr:YlxR family protein [Actinomycetota bacterium]